MSPEPQFEGVNPMRPAMRCERGKSQDSQLDNERVIPPLVTGYKEEGRDTSQVQVKALGAVLSGLSTLYKSC